MSVAAPNFLTLEQALADLGKAWVLIGDPFTASGLSVLGLTEGDITPAFNPEFSTRTYPEHTGPAIHRAKLLGYSPTVDISLIMGDPAAYAKVSPTASAGGGHAAPQDVTETALVLVPEAEFAGGFAFAADAWTNPLTGPKHAVWFWRGYFTTPALVFGGRNTDTGKRTATVTFQAMFSDSADVPDGKKLFVIGDPDAQGVGSLAI